ncbi:MAG TPA: hypothetical protein VN729_00070 [Ktedonobacteraceae bacterium]|nr:hypothetical protein [Ktedonobacteraceae bacterium]
MLQSWKLETAVFMPMHIIFERRASDAYKLEDSALPATPHLQDKRPVVSTTTRLWESLESDAYLLEESTLTIASLLQDEMQAAASSAPSLAREIVEQVEYEPAVESEVQPVSEALTQVKFRQALIEVDDPDDFWAGVVGGQIAALEERLPLTGTQLFELFEDAACDLEFSETWLAGYLLGLSDALLRHRKVYPRAYAARLKPLSRHAR